VDGAHTSAAREEISDHAGLRIAQVAAAHPAPLDALCAQLGGGGFDMVCLFVSPDADFEQLTREAAERFGGADVLACTTAGELGRDGYEDGQIIAVAYPSDLFCVRSYVLGNLNRLNEQGVIDDLIQHRLALGQRAGEMGSEFAFLMVDGLSMREEHLAAMLAAGLGPMPLFGGSSGDGTAFANTYLAHNGTVYQNAAVVALVRSHCRIKVFSLDHLIPTEMRMVVTRADIDKRLVHEINAAPAAAEYARLLGKDPNQLDPFIFAAHPVVVRLGDTHHVRAIRQVTEDGDLVFFSAINEGMVLTLADHQDIVQHLKEALAALGKDGAPLQILGCDCILRRIEAGQLQKTREMSQILTDHRVIGFSTYGEQIGALHVNQTLTGVAIYAPDEA
jgi:hypothetical protein